MTEQTNQDGASAPSGDAPVRRRRGRPRKSESQQAVTTPKTPKRRRGRPRKSETLAASSAPVSHEVAAARALSQVSQAEIARQQRQEEERIAAKIASGDISQLIDPTLRPHRRGRKPKAYIEAERAAAAALAAKQAEYIAGIDSKKAAPEQSPRLGASHGQQSEQPVVGVRSRDARPGRAERAQRGFTGDVASPFEIGQATERFMRASRQQLEQATVPARPHEPRQPVSPLESLGAIPAPDAAAQTSLPREHEAQGGSSAAEGHTIRAHASEERARETLNSEGRTRDAQAVETRASERPVEHHQHSQRTNQRQQNNRNKRNNRFNAPTEPTLTRDELSELKVADLRNKAKELNLDYLGKKKAELVEEIYTAAARAEGFREIAGILDIDAQGFGYIRAQGYHHSREDAFVAANMIRAAALRPGDYVVGTLRPLRANDKYPGLARIQSINGLDPDASRQRPKFSDLTPIYPDEPLRMEHGRDSVTGRAIDIVAPVGKGQRGLIVSPPKAGKTTILKRICQSIAINNPEVHLICLLVDERPEEVTDMQRSIKGDVVASTFDMPAENHTRISELVIERAKRLVELGEDVVVVLDSITRLARAYNLAAPASGRILSGGVDSAALYPPKRFLGAARNIEHGGSLTILASALVDTGSKMDEVIFEEFKGTGNMELKLDRDLADRRIFPAIDPVASGTRNEDLLIDEQMRPFMWGIRRVLANMNNTERAAASFIKGLKATDNNQEFLVRSAKRAQDSELA
ncbi:transcription termination factor Rho [Collinsella sp. zg1085]|uniref:transcription termination factor Rho n=1 Tax=Collinsella sp. zg1085 TaxID=2844380 RepID=UPI001C0D3175|nr:transcription termination factor Rho [Collinsella sp. zg1085]QWT18145.1 transcription termination factor Rho [Collinsella sp. zg1085]